MTPTRTCPGLRYRENSLESVLSVYDLNSAAMSERVQLLQQWIEKQNHFNKRDFSRNFLETSLISCKGSIERAKSRLDKYCTLRTMMPRFFDKIDARRDFKDMHSAIKVAILPNYTEDLYRVIIIKVSNNNLNLSSALDFYKFGTLCLEYLKARDHFIGAVVVVDYMGVSMTEAISALNPIDLGDAVKLYTDGYGLKLKGVHFLTSSKMVDVVVSLLKSVVSAKLGNRIHVHNTVESLHNYIPADILPTEYKGTQKSYLSIHEDCLDMLSTEENLQYLREMKKAHTNECYRTVDEFNSKYLGTPGTFRFLTVD